MNRDEFLFRFDSDSTKRGYKKVFKKFDGFLNSINRSEKEWLDILSNADVTNKYNMLQEVINYLKETGISNAVIRNYFDNLFKYLLLSGIELDYTQKRIRLKFPRVVARRFEGLDRENINKILSLKFGSFNFKVYLRVLAGGGFRENEALQLKPYMIRFNEFPIRIIVPGEITKFNIPRETFLPKITGRLLRKLIADKDVKDDETIFVKNWNDRSLNDFERVFDLVRVKTELDTKNRRRYQQNDITLHSFRAFFITTFTDHDKERFGHALSGHSKDLSVYFRKSLKQRQIEYLQVSNDIDFESFDIDYEIKKAEILDKAFNKIDDSEMIQEFKRSAV